MEIAAYMLSCPERDAVCAQTVKNLVLTDWSDSPRIEIDRTTYERRQQRQEQTSLTMLSTAIADQPDFILFLEDDLIFNRCLRYNLEHWRPLRQSHSSDYFFGSLYNPGVAERYRRPELAYFVADAECVYGSQAFIFSLATARYAVDHWYDVVGMQDIKLSRLAARLSPIYYHLPSLVQHVGYHSVWGGHFHSARDFQEDWMNPWEAVDQPVSLFAFQEKR